MTMFGASLALLVALLLSARNLRFLLCGRTATGRVRSYVKSDDETVLFAPTVAFESDEGQERVFTSLFGSVLRAYKIDEEVPVRYLDKSAEIDGFTELWLIPVIFACVSAFLFAIALN